MKILLYTFEMVRGVEHLMPWRTLVEVAKNAPSAFEVAICSAEGQDGIREYDGVTIFSVDYGVAALERFLQSGGWDVVYYPITYRQGLRNMAALATIKARKIAYIPGGLCPLSGSLKLIQMGEVKRALPYLLDTITPHSWIAKKLQKVGFEAIVCQAPLTSRDALNSGWKKAITALPGKETVALQLDDSFLERLGLKGEKFVLFSGAPAPTRGAIMAMRAFDAIADRVPDTKMVMLMRKDVSSDFSAFEQAAARIRHKDRFIISYEKLTREQLFCFFKEAYAVLLPFLIIPSEIPLTYFEVMSYGTPVITFENGGTTDYLREGLKIAKHRTVSSLSDAIVELCNNHSEREQLAHNAISIMDNHPSWEETAMDWFGLLTRIITN